MKKVLFILLLIFSLVYSGKGTTGYQMLISDVGAVGQSLGGAYTTNIKGVESLYWNPAGLGKSKNIDIMFEQNIGFQGSFSEYFAGVYPYRELGQFGFNLFYKKYGEVEARDRLGNKGQLLNPYEFYLGGFYGDTILPELQIGGGVKLLYSSLDMYSSAGFVLDFGVIYCYSLEKFQFGFVKEANVSLVVKNLGYATKYYKQSDMMPITISLGGGTKFLDDSLKTELDLVYSIDKPISILFGVEYLILNQFLVRLGIDTRKDIGLMLTGGFGYEYKKIRMNYSIKLFGDLGLEHRINIGYSF